MADRSYCEIDVNGQGITDALDDILISLTVSDKAGSSSDTCQLEIDDTDGRVRMPPIGAQIVIRLGSDRSGIAEVFRGTVDEVRSNGSRGGGRTLRLSGKGVDTTKKAKEPQTRHIDNSTLEDALKKAGEAAGITTIRVDQSLRSIRRDYWSLDNESFIAFGERIAREVGGTFKVQNDTAVMGRRGSGRSPQGETMPTVAAIWGSNLLDWDISPVLGRPRYKEVRGRFYDRQAARWRDVTVQVPREDTGPTLTRRQTSADRDEAQNGADNDATDSAKNKGEGNVTILGDFLARPEGTCIVSGARPGIDGDYKIESVEHTYSRTGWLTKLSLKQPGEEPGNDTRTAGQGRGQTTTATGAVPTPPARPAVPTSPTGGDPRFVPTVGREL